MQNSGITIGRDPRSDIRVPESFDTVSNSHAAIEQRGDVLTYTDHSSNGTVINGQKIHNTSVGIYPGDRIMLAGVYELDWQTLGRFFPDRHRPTVVRNVHGEDSGASGRRTVRMETPQQPESGPLSSMSGIARHGRATERFDRENPPTPKYQPGFVSTEAPSYGQENTYSQAEIDRALGRWNWGAFFCSWIWGVCHKQKWTLCMIPLAFIPYIGQVANLCISVHLGMKGSRFAWESGKYASFERYVAAQKKWAIGGLVFFLCSLAYSAWAVDYMLSAF